MCLTMVGSGYVGLVTGVGLADSRHSVVCVDQDPGKIAALIAGWMPIYEPNLSDLVAENVSKGRLSFVTELSPAVAPADAVFIAVGTPSRRGDGPAIGA